MKLDLVITNPGELLSGLSAASQFSETGGVIGSASDAEWMIGDSSAAIADHHARVSFIDGAFCFEVLATAGVSVNGFSEKLASGQVFRINDGDRVQIGRLVISAFVTTADSSLGGTRAGLDRYAALETILKSDIIRDETKQTSFDSLADFRTDTLAARLVNDPIQVLNQGRGSVLLDREDPLLCLDDDENDLRNSFIIANFHEDPGPVELKSVAAPVSDSIGERSHLSADPAPDGLLRDQWLGDVTLSDEPIPAIDHVLLRPLCEGLGLNIGHINAHKADALARSVGLALRTAISGIMELHSNEMLMQGRIIDTQLHAIEDNPLRLDQSADEAINDLFLIRSPVHLSGADAIQESLSMLRRHSHAAEKACNQALDHVLAALSPEVLSKRFEKYKGHAPRTGDPAAWNWEMYHHYYDAMRPDRQGGLTRMFWEIYRQVYDREMRIAHMED